MTEPRLAACVLLVFLFSNGCAAGLGPASPSPFEGNPGSSGVPETQTQLWGYYDLVLDTENLTIDIIPNRALVFTANVVTFLNKVNPSIEIDIWGMPVTDEYIDVDCDISITHPFPDMTQYNGYDVRGIFIGQGSCPLMYDSGLRYAVPGTSDQLMYDYDLGDDPDIGYDDPWDGLVGMPDGYTRWWNAVEFSIEGVLGYTDGKLTSGDNPAELTATLNPYKYFADGIGVSDSLFTYLEEHAGDDYFEQGIFRAGSTNRRNYYLRFPIETALKFSYAVTADWGEHEEDEPPPPESHMVEAAALEVDYHGDVFYIIDWIAGGTFIADISVWSWDIQPSNLIIETDLHSQPVIFNQSSIIGGTENYSVWHCEFEPDSVLSGDNHNYWVTCEYPSYDYSAKGTDYSQPGTYPDAPLAAFFRFEFYVLGAPCGGNGPDVEIYEPKYADVDTSFTMSLTGTFDEYETETIYVWLAKLGESDIYAYEVNKIDANHLEACFTIPGNTKPGLWTLLVNYDCTDYPTYFEDGFEIRP